VTRARASAHIRIGTSGWAYKHWRRAFYPRGLRQRDELAFIAQHFTSVELNGSFYSLQRPDSYRAWHAQTPDHFVFAIKGSRFISHNKKLRDVDTPLANFFASGVLLLQKKLGPIVWQLPEQARFDADRLDRFLTLLPRNTEAAAALAKHHDARVKGEPWTNTDARRPLRYAIEPRNREFVPPECLDLLRHHDVALVAADSGRWPLFEETTASFTYVRLHGSPITYASQYTDAALDHWATRIKAWSTIGDVYIYFDNDGHAHAPQDALRLSERLELRKSTRDHDGRESDDASVRMT
jgi:uncharacterized protein YecE (DUF72 family)